MKCSYIEVLENKIIIPIIQRDYAQGRQDGKTIKIRQDFLDVIFDTIATNLNGNIKKLELDFIYGINKGKINKAAFVPIDGQQRLTTLWLLYWFVAKKEQVPNEEQMMLAKFVYETRYSTTVFCKQLIDHQFQDTYKPINEDIKNQAWYFDTWDNDPSIQAMLVVLKEIEARYEQLDNSNVWNVLIDSNGPFYFYKLDMDNVGLSDDLYIKMNSRGKALTEFEYFKVGFTEIIQDAALKKRFEQSIDQKWSDAIWSIVKESPLSEKSKDIALLVDNCFLNLFNFITQVLAHKKGIIYKDTIESRDLLEKIYDSKESQEFLFSTLDAICEMQGKHPDFWSEIFYFEKDQFDIDKTRLFFQNKNVNLLERCLFEFNVKKGLSYSEQLMLYAVLLHIKEDSSFFKTHIRIVRNLVINSDNELRPKTFGENLKSIDNLILDNNLNEIKNFKTDQLKEEREKQTFLDSNSNVKPTLYRLEDSDVLRGCTSIFELNDQFSDRAEQFLKLFDENKFKDDSEMQTSLLLCFGDYSQAGRNSYNLIGKGMAGKRGFFTTPGVGKQKDIFSKTRPVLMDCLDYFIQNPNESTSKKITSTLRDYKSQTKDWKFYLLKYYNVRKKSNYGYFKWYDNERNNLFCIMSKERTSGHHWDMFLYCVNKQIESENVSLGNYHHNNDEYFDEGCLKVEAMKSIISISSESYGYLFENDINGVEPNVLLQKLIEDGIINKEAQLLIQQNDEGTDLEDRVEKLKETVLVIIDKY